MFNVHVYASPFSIVLLLISLSVWLCICRWGFRYNLKDSEMGLPRHAQFLARTVFVKNDDVTKACRILNRILAQEGFLDQYRRTRYFEKPTQTRRRVNYERCKAIYNEDMNRRIGFLLRKNRVDPFPGCS